MKQFFTALLIIGMALGMNACKKGENDPMISLASRTQRITGIWELTDYEEITTTKRMLNGNLSTEERTKRLENGQLVSTSPYVTFDAYDYSSTLTILKDGTYEVTFNNDQNYGTWWWKDAGKSKTSIGFSNNFLQSIILLELTNSQMVWQIDSYSKIYTSDIDYVENTISITYTYNK